MCSTNEQVEIDPYSEVLLECTPTSETISIRWENIWISPPENLITQGYGEQYLKVLTAGPERANRRASVRRITPLLVGQL